MRLIILSCFLLISTIAFADDDEPVIVAEGVSPSDCVQFECDGYINFLFTNVNDGVVLIHSSNGGPYVVFVNNGIGQLLGMCEGEYNGLYVVVNDCSSEPIDVSINFYEPPAPSVISGTYCHDDLIPDLLAVGEIEAIFIWYDSNPFVNPSATILGYGTTWTPSGEIGTETVYVTQAVNYCESMATEVTVTINDCVNTEDLIQQEIIVNQTSLNGHLNVKGELSHFNRIEIVSINGGIVSSKLIMPFTKQMNFSLQSGIYIVRFWGENGVYSKKVIMN